MTAEQVLVAADELARGGLLDGGATIAFAHPLMREAVLSGIGEHQLSLAHRQRRAHPSCRPARRSSGSPAMCCAPRRTATSENVADLMSAAADALRRGSPQAALDCLSRAAAEPPQPPVDAVVQVMRGFAEFKLARFADAAQHLAAAARVADADVNVVLAHTVAVSYSDRIDDAVVRSLLDSRASARAIRSTA